VNIVYSLQKCYRTVQIIIFNKLGKIIGGRDSSVGIATGYGMDGPGIEKKIPVGVRFSEPA
jgi:hypothetical protein